MAVSHKWVSYVQRCIFTLTNAHNPNQIQVRLAIFRQNFYESLLFGPLIFHSLGPRIYYTNFYYFRLYAFMYVEKVKNTSFHECFKIFISIYFKANFIRLALHSRMFKNTTFHEWAFFIRYCIDGSATCFRLSNTTKETQSRDTNNREACPTNALVGKGPPCHKSSSRSG